MAGFLDKLGSVAAAVGLAEKVDQSQLASSQQAPTPQYAATPSYGTGSQTAPTVAPRPFAGALDPARAAELDNQARAVLINAMENDGAPLCELFDADLETMREAITDEMKLYTTAIKMFVKKKHTVAALLGDFDRCLSVLDDNKRNFETTQKTQFDAKVGAARSTVESIDQQIGAKNQQIQQLQGEITSLQGQRGAAAANISLEQTKIEQVQSRFTAVFAAIREHVQTQRTKIAQYGQGII